MEKHFYLCNTQKENTSKARGSIIHCPCFEEIFSTGSATTKGSFIHRSSKRIGEHGIVGERSQHPTLRGPALHFGLLKVGSVQHSIV